MFFKQNNLFGFHICQTLVWYENFLRIWTETPIEQVFELSKNKWQIFSMNHFTTKLISPVTISYSTVIGLEPGCKMLLQANILYAEEEEETNLEPVLF